MNILASFVEAGFPSVHNDVDRVVVRLRRHHVQPVPDHVVADRIGYEESNRSPFRYATAEHRSGDIKARHVEPGDIAIDETLDLFAPDTFARHDGNTCPVEQFVRTVPRRQTLGAVSANDHDDLLAAEAVNRVDRERPAISVDLSVVDGEVVDSRGREFDHAEAVAGF